MKIYIGSDHTGFEIKEKLKEYFTNLGHEMVDKGPFSLDQDDDYPDFIRPVAEAVVEDPGSVGIIMGRSGQGEAMCANRVPGARAAVYYGEVDEIVRLAREHNDANILSLGVGFLGEEKIKLAIELFLKTEFSGEERHVRRIKKLETRS
jgi:ribose 5-phosphate isomerase B